MFVLDGVKYPSRRLAYQVRRENYVKLLQSGLNSTQAAKAVGVSKRTAKVWRNGRTRANGRNEAPSIDWPPLAKKTSSKPVDPT
jgi:transposase